MEQILTEGLRAMGLTADDARVKTLTAYGELLLQTNAVTNLT